MGKPIFLLHLAYGQTQETLNRVRESLEKKIGEDYHVLVLLDDKDMVQVFTDREIMPKELQIELDKLLA